jgi:hypothetical protein
MGFYSNLIDIKHDGFLMIYEHQIENSKHHFLKNKFKIDFFR